MMVLYSNIYTKLANEIIDIAKSDEGWPDESGAVSPADTHEAADKLLIALINELTKLIDDREIVHDIQRSIIAFEKMEKWYD